MIFFRSLNLTVDWDGMGCGFGVLGVGLRRLSEEEEASHHGLYIAPLWPCKQRNATEGEFAFWIAPRAKSLLHLRPLQF
ncbi:hypothetical protein DAI22_02g336700 [Oryza sativa Japonica Group]|nr:hypothetical protein DAI22_02g336700 [Oryza sativa Japonica Group]